MPDYHVASYLNIITVSLSRIWANLRGQEKRAASGGGLELLKIRIKTKDCNLKVRLKTNFGDTFDAKKLDQFCRTCSRGFLKPHLLKKNLIEYRGPVGISLYDRLNDPMSKRDFLFVLEQVVVVLQKIEANQLDLNALVLNLNHVFINKMTREVWFLYAPTVKKSGEVDVRGFLESIVYSVKPNEKDDQEFISRFMYFLRGEKEIAMEKIESYIAREDSSVVRLIRKQTGGQSGFITNKMQHYVEHYEKKDSDENATELMENPQEGADEEATGLLDGGSRYEAFEANVEEDEATGLLQEGTDWQDDEATGLLEEDADWQDDEATGVLHDNDAVPLPTDCEGTVLLNENASSARFHTLYRVSNEERISINKPVFRLGKEKSYVDYFVTNNVAVSRSHADLITRGDKCFVMDLNSKNHTYINDEMIPANCEIEIHDEDRLRLGNEEFIFYR